MATIREGNKPVLLVVDVQTGVMRNAWNAPRIIQNIAAAAQKARNAGVPVIWVQHSDQGLVYESPDWEIVPELSPVSDEIKIQKNYNSSFEQTSLEDILARLGVTHIFLAGAATNWCIRATAYAALDRGYDLTLLEDAHTTGPIELEDGNQVKAADIIAELNTVMDWLSYPGRISSVATVEGLAFPE